MLHLFTIVLDGMPWVRRHYDVFRQLKIPWHWHVVEGVAAPERCTNWCAELQPRLSDDGTTAYLDTLRFDRRVSVRRKVVWPGKVSMINTVLREIKEPCLLWEVDSDELWTPTQIQAVYDLFQKHPDRTSAWFYCQFFLGADIVTTTVGAYGNNTDYEWKRVWRFQPGMEFKTHEPPVIAGLRERPFTHEETKAVGAVFKHMAYATERQVEFKQRYYAGSGNPKGRLYRNAVEGWKRLQENQSWPVKLNRFLPWVDNRATATRL
jgi:hypothetical protein